MSTHSFPLIATIAVVVAGTLGDETASDVTAAAPSVVTITATDYAFQAPDTIAAGFTTFRLVNNSDQVHMAQLIRLEPGKTMEEYIEAHSEAFRTRGPRPEWAKRVGGPGAARPHTAHGMVQHIRITAAQKKPPLALTHVAVVNVADGSVKPDMTVLLQGSRIRAVGPTAGVSLPEAAVVVNAAGKFLIPGLWDMHVHSAPRVAWHFPLMVAHGVTGVRNMHTTADTALELIRSVKRRLAAGELIGPRFLANGPIVDGDPSVWEGAVLVRTPAEARTVVDSLAAGGADFIKVYDNLPRDAYFAIADQARRRGIPMVGHVPFRIRPEEAARAGQRTDEHASGLSFGCSTRADSIRSESVRLAARAPSMPFVEALVAGFRLERALYDTRSPSRCAATIDAYRRHGVAVVPTLVIARNPNYPELVLSDTAILQFIPAALRREWEGLAGPGVGDTLRPLLRPTIRPRLDNVRQLNAAGVLILAGTDLGNPLLVPGVSLHQELELLVEAGLTPLEALRSATLNPAKFLGATDSLGTIESGKLADLVLIEANPLENIANTRKIAAVVLDGRYFDRHALDDLLARAATEAGRR